MWAFSLIPAARGRGLLLFCRCLCLLIHFPGTNPLLSPDFLQMEYIFFLVQIWTLWRGHQRSLMNFDNFLGRWGHFHLLGAQVVWWNMSKLLRVQGRTRTGTSFLTPSSSHDAWFGATSIKIIAKTNSEGVGLWKWWLFLRGKWRGKKKAFCAILVFSMALYIPMIIRRNTSIKCQVQSWISF